MSVEAVEAGPGVGCSGKGLCRGRAAGGAALVAEPRAQTAWVWWEAAVGLPLAPRPAW